VRRKLSLWQELEDDWQEKFQEPRDDLWVSGIGYIKILQRETEIFPRMKYEGDKSNKKRITRKKNIIWEVGDVVSVSVGEIFKKKEETKDNITELTIENNPQGDGCIGKLKLIKIEPHKDFDNLYFEVVEF